ncbi:MAG: excinuclease ABC subunit UvrC [Ruminococcaceae bacterium]|nr:excinuclease ABC subunit UvrC [Oscillospiraceae bacterium]
MTKEELRAKANDLPLAPGVYLMMDKTGKVIYVGKAKKLKNRVSQYFQENNASHNEKTRRMVSQVDRFDTIFVSSEFEALILENSLIKQHMPHYNILLKDDKGYPFVRLGKGPYARFTMVNKPVDDGARYFGPFGGRSETRAAIDAVCAAFKLPTCSRRFPRDIGKERPCLNHHMGRCDGFCRGTPDEKEYTERIEQATQLLTGHYKTLTRTMREEMQREAEALRFEQAAALRDRIGAIESLGKRQKVIAGICADTDVWGVYRGAAKCGWAVIHVEDGSVTGRETDVFTAPTDESEADMLSALLNQYYLPRAVLPREILLPVETPDAEELAGVLTERAGRKVSVHVPQRGDKAELLRMAERNAREDVERVTTLQERENKTLALLGEMLSLPEPPRRMESYDISNTGASDIVASMVVYEGAKPKKSDYRRFHMKTVSAHPDDYASMEEVLTRRLRRYLDGDEKFAPLPDVMLIDGGATHAQVAERVCAALNLPLPIFGMVKDDRHHTRALVTAGGREIDLRANPAVFALIGQIQDETHRFAITFHHESHTRTSLHSALDDIPGVGKTRKAALLKAFRSVKAIREADIEALEKAVPRSTAQAVWEHFHGTSESKPE